MRRRLQFIILVRNCLIIGRIYAKQRPVLIDEKCAKEISFYIIQVRQHLCMSSYQLNICIISPRIRSTIKIRIENSKTIWVLLKLSPMCSLSLLCLEFNKFLGLLQLFFVQIGMITNSKKKHRERRIQFCVFKICSVYVIKQQSIKS